MEEFLRGSISVYLEELASRSAAPGGGSVSALTAALGAGLNLMVMNYSADGESMAELRKEQREILGRLSALIDSDCAAFRALMRALAEKRDAEDAFKDAARVPLETCRGALRSLELTAELSGKANSNLATDIGCAAYNLMAAFRAARLNVETNLAHIADTDFSASVSGELESMETDMEDAYGRAIKGMGDLTGGDGG
jgi:methenyltetrahydrofolate cyclohydrolase